MERLCNHLAETLHPGTPLTDRLFNWTGDLGPRAESLPLRVCGALHALRLLDRAGLVAVYPPNAPDDATFAAAITQAIKTEAAFIDDWINTAPQTNEVRRSAAIIPAAHWLHARHPLPFRVSELGASGGLNMAFDQFGLTLQDTHYGPANATVALTPDWSGPLPPRAAPAILERGGVDLHPIDPHTPKGKLRLLAYLWPDQPERRARTEAAIAVASAAPDKADAIDWLAPRLAHRAGMLHMVYTTIAWQYFPAKAQARGTAMICNAGAAATAETPLAWFSMENDGGAKGAALTLRLWPGDLTITLGRADFHGAWVDWTAPAPNS